MLSPAPADGCTGNPPRGRGDWDGSRLGEMDFVPSVSPQGLRGAFTPSPEFFLFQCLVYIKRPFQLPWGAPSCPPWTPLPPSTLSPYGLHSHGFPAPLGIWRKGRPSPVPSYGGQGQAGTFHPTLPQHLLTHILCNPPALAPSGPPLPTAHAPRVQPLMVAAPHRLPSLTSSIGTPEHIPPPSLPFPVPPSTYTPPPRHIVFVSGCECFFYETCLFSSVLGVVLLPPKGSVPFCAPPRTFSSRDTGVYFTAMSVGGSGAGGGTGEALRRGAPPRSPALLTPSWGPPDLHRPAPMAPRAWAPPPMKDLGPCCSHGGHAPSPHLAELQSIVLTPPPLEPNWGLFMALSCPQP